MNTKLASLFLSVVAISSNAFGVYNPTWERPIFKSEDMNITEARQRFAKAKKVTLTLTKRDGEKDATGMILSIDFPHSNRPEVTKFKVESVTVDRCGSTQYFAKLPTKSGNASLEHRFSVALTDHTLRRCKDRKAHQWEANVREGYGWCGTMDATMSLEGEPEAVVSIQSGN